MNRLVIAVIILVLALGAGYAAWPASGSDTNPPPAKLVTVTGIATVSTAPDEAVIAFGVRTQGLTNEPAVQRNATIMNAVMKALAAQGVDKADIKTTDFNLYNHCENRGTKRETCVAVANDEISVTVRDLSKVSAVIDAAVAAGVTDVGRMEFQLSDESKAQQQALDEAVKSAQTKAGAIASASGATLGSIVSLREVVQNNSRYGDTDSFGGPVLASVSWAPAVPVSPQQVQTQVTVTAVFDLNG